MDNAEVECTGTLYRLDPDLSVHVVCTDVHLSNGLGWSPDDRVLYYTDSLRRTIWAYDFDLATGGIENRRIFARVPDDAGVPDGLCVDAQGHVWSAHWGGWRLTRYAPDGRIDRVVPMPVPQPSCPAFGGPDLDVLYVSSAAIGMTPADFARAPDGGGLFALDPGVGGLPVNRFAG
jgi:sugar lactone lactonase YvrE